MGITRTPSPNSSLIHVVHATRIAGIQAGEGVDRRNSLAPGEAVAVIGSSGSGRSVQIHFKSIVEMGRRAWPNL